MRLLLLVGAIVCSQFLANAQRAGGRSAGSTPPAIGEVMGQVVDAATSEPVPFAAVSVMSLRDSSIAGGQLADENGQFFLKNIPLGRSRLQVNFMGYDPWKSAAFSLSPRTAIVFDAGVIQLQSRINNLEEAIVLEEASTLEMLIDRRVFNVGNDLSAAGGTASELLVNVPSVSVDIDGNISLRGSSNVQILIDGRPSGMTGATENAFLEQIPASAIDRIEVITNPSAKYDPDGMAGILNIILKKNKLQGFHGQLQATPGTGDNYNSSISLNFKNEQYSLFSSASWNQRDQFNIAETFRRFDAIDSTSELTQMKDGNRLRASLSGKVGAEWYPSPSEVLSVSVNFSGNESTRTGTTLNDEDWDTGYLLSTERADTNDSKGAGQDVDVSYRKEFENNPSHFFRAMVRHSNSDSDNENFIIESLRGLDGMSIADTNIQHTARIRTVAQIDFEKPLPNEGKWEWGLKSNISNSTDEYVYLSPDSSVWENGLYVPINAQRSGYDFNYHEEVHAAYSTFGRKWGVWGVQSGLRLEQVFTSATITGEDPFKNDYFSVYPSFNISRQRSDEVSWIGSYSRRVNRPRGRQVSPFIDDRDNRNIRTGNPELRPEYTHSMEFGHQWSKGRKSITTSLFVKQTNDVIRRFSTVDEAGISTSSYLNLDARRDEGLEVVAMSSLGRGGSFRFTGSVYHLANSVGDVENASDNEGWSYSANVFANKSFGTDGLWKWQVNGMHRGPSVTAQGQFNGFTFADASVQRKLFDGDLTITLKLSDVFNTRQWSYSSDFQRLYQESTYKRESQNLFLTISWNLGKLEAGKGRTGRPSSGGASGGMDGVDF